MAAAHADGGHLLRHVFGCVEAFEKFGASISCNITHLLEFTEPEIFAIRDSVHIETAQHNLVANSRCGIASIVTRPRNPDLAAEAIRPAR